jgi:hypothetical protein
MFARALVVAFALAASGCLSSQEVQPGTPQNGSTPTVPSLDNSEAGGTAQNQIVSVIGSSCSGVTTGVSLPGAIAPGHAPPEWKPDPVEGSISGLGVDLRNCHRLSVGPFERPAYFMLETHGTFSAPDNCTSGRPEIMPMAFISAIIVSDLEIAQVLNQSLHFPVTFGSISNSSSQLLSAGEATWLWARTDYEPSSLTVFAVGNTTKALEKQNRYFWDNGPGISYIDLTQRTIEPEVEAYATVGTMKAPMLFHEAFGENYVAPSNLIFDSEMTGTIHVFGDNQCSYEL